MEGISQSALGRPVTPSVAGEGRSTGSTQIALIFRLKCNIARQVDRHRNVQKIFHTELPRMAPKSDEQTPLLHNGDAERQDNESVEVGIRY